MTSFDPNRITYIGEADFRSKRVKFGIKASDRTRHVYVIGKTGVGKSVLLENMAVQDIQNGEGFAFIDPHGKTADLLLDYIPENRVDDVLYFAPFDLAHPVSFNVMEDIGPDKRHLVASGLMSAFKKIWVDAWSARMEYMLSNTILALLEYPESTLLGISRMFADKAFRKEVVSHVTDPGVKSFWVNEFANYTDKFAAEATPAIQNKIGQFTANPVIRNLIGQPKSTFNIREMMDNRKILIINLSKGQVGEDSANLLGSMMITKIYLAAMSRADMREPELNKLPNFYLYVDEFQSFANESFADILSEARKYKLNLTIAHQYIEQMSDEVRAAVFGNVGTMITFRVGATDAEYLEKEYAPMFTAEDLVNLDRYQIYLKLMIDGMASSPFSARTLPPIAHPHISYRDVAIGRSQEQFSRPRQVVEEEIISWHHKSFDGRPEERGEGGGQGERGGRGGDRGPRNDAPRGPREGERRDTQRQEPRDEGRRDAPKQGFREGPRQASSGDGRSPFPQERRGTGTPGDREAELRKAISLDRLKADEKKKKSKGPTEERLSSLRDALASVLQKTDVVANDIERLEETPRPTTHVKQKAPDQVVHQKQQQPQSQAPHTPKPQSVPEVPKEVLEKLFEREEKKTQ